MDDSLHALGEELKTLDASAKSAAQSLLTLSIGDSAGLAFELSHGTKFSNLSSPFKFLFARKRRALNMGCIASR